ncbi:hypothetical protein EDC01DRAFT_650346 [Geopyxis carbonaria]|nr:hypothetical protein EDC01DRAFT_650346 [Geopyxis carbonaria]
MTTTTTVRFRFGSFSARRGHFVQAPCLLCFAIFPSGFFLAFWISHFGFSAISPVGFFLVVSRCWLLLR